MKIIGTGSAIPELLIKNTELERFLDTSDEWIRTRTGIEERRVHSGNLEGLAAEAARRAISDAGLTIADIDFLICSTVYNRFMTPGLSCVIQGLTGAACPCIDINGACAGFVYALEMADAYLARGHYHNILIVCAEEPTRMVDWTDRATCVLFGDGAAAAVVSGEGDTPLFQMHTASNTDVLYAYNTAGNCPYDQSGRMHQPLHMNGQEVYKFAVSSATESIRTLCSASGLELSDIGHFVLHQANLRILEAVRTRLQQPVEKFPHNLEHYGNTSSASVPLLLDELNRAGILTRGEKIAMSAFGAGLTTGACLFTW